ncbi:MAG TPA: LysR substrate-binding domain-containing protein [Rhizomicrobium sp.]|nr:LysR substrate-binding domain-containing protein [Rhizomicrobium sp.]
MTGPSFWSQFELRQLRCFVAAAEELHFGRAAARMNMTQPPLSRQIQLLEHVLGVKLLDRTSRAVKLTPAGRVFLLEARRILRLTESAALATRRIASGEAGTIALGFTAASGYSFLPRLLLQRASHAPNIDVVLKEMVSSEQMESLLTGRIDVGLLRPPIGRGEFTVLKVAEERLVAALPVGDPRLVEAMLTLTHFDRRPLIMYSAEGARYFHDMLGELFEAEGISPIAIQSLSQIHSMLALVRAGIGAALVPEAAQSLHFDDVHFRPVETDPLAPVELYAAWRSDNDNPALAAFLDLLRPEPEASDMDALAASNDDVLY